MHVLIIDQCCKRKEHPTDSATLSAEEIDGSTREELRTRADLRTVPAADLYAGRQQAAIDRAVDTLRTAGHTVTRVFISAGFGVIGETEQLPPYNVTFSGMSANAIRERANSLSITTDLLDVIHESPDPDVAFLPLGADYFTAIDINAVLAAFPEETIQVLYNNEERAEKGATTVSLPARNADASKYGVNAIELKGHYIERFASKLGDQDGEIVLSSDSVLSLCTAEDSTQSGLGSF